MDHSIVGFWTINRLFSVRFSDHHLNTGPFENWTQLYQLLSVLRFCQNFCISIYSGGSNTEHVLILNGWKLLGYWMVWIRNGIPKLNNPTIPNLTKLPPSWITMHRFHFWMVGTIAIAVAMVPIILIPNHHKTEHQNCSDIECFWIRMFGIRALTVIGAWLDLNLKKLVLYFQIAHFLWGELAVAEKTKNAEQWNRLGKQIRPPG